MSERIEDLRRLQRRCFEKFLKSSGQDRIRFGQMAREYGARIHALLSESPDLRDRRMTQ